MSRCPECGAYSDLTAKNQALAVCPVCKAMFPKQVIVKKPFNVNDAKTHIDYLQTAVLELGKTIENLMVEIKKNRKQIQTLKGRLK